jgi:hypothetical protein
MPLICPFSPGGKGLRCEPLGLSYGRRLSRMNKVREILNLERKGKEWITATHLTSPRQIFP